MQGTLMIFLTLSHLDTNSTADVSHAEIQSKPTDQKSRKTAPTIEPAATLANKQTVRAS
jgi:hypothetical protein